MKSLRDTTKKVKSFLITIPETRDDDKLLLTLYWKNELTDMGIDALKANAWGLLNIIAKGELTNADYICRCRRRLQQLYPELRGAKYAQRYENQSNAQTELGYGNGN